MMPVSPGRRCPSTLRAAPSTPPRRTTVAGLLAIGAARGAAVLSPRRPTPQLNDPPLLRKGGSGLITDVSSKLRDPARPL